MNTQGKLESLLYRCLVSERRVPDSKELAAELNMDPAELVGLDKAHDILKSLWNMDEREQLLLVKLAGERPDDARTLRSLFYLVAASELTGAVKRLKETSE